MAGCFTPAFLPPSGYVIGTGFDRLFIGVTPGHVIRIRGDILYEEDGPMLLHGLKGLHDRRLLPPRAGRSPVWE